MVAQIRQNPADLDRTEKPGVAEARAAGNHPMAFSLSRSGKPPVTEGDAERIVQQQFEAVGRS
jgi:hypothetical protein